MKCVRHYVNEKDVKRVSNKKAEKLVSTGSTNTVRERFLRD